MTSTSNTRCFSVPPTATPLVTVPAIGDTPPFSIFADLGGTTGNTTILQALEFSDSTIGSYSIIPNQNGTGISVVISDGYVIEVNDGVNASSFAIVLQIPVCSNNSAPSKRELRKIETDSFAGHQFLPYSLNSRQAVGSGGADVSLDVINECNQPVTGLNPPPGSQGDQSLLMFCEIAQNQNAVFGSQGHAYFGSHLVEGPTGHYTGACSFPPSITCSSITGAISNLCSAVFPPGTTISTFYICGLLQIGLEVPGVYTECTIALGRFELLCLGLGTLSNVASISFCDRIPFPKAPTSVEIQITVEGEGDVQFTLSNAVDIESTGGAVQDDIGTYIVPGPCVNSTLSTYTCSTTMLPSSTAAPTTTSATGGACNAMPMIVDGGFEDGQQALTNYYFPTGGTFDVVCGGANGLSAACGNCFGRNYGGGEISVYFQACPGSSHTFSAVVAMEPGSSGSCTVQMYLYEVGTVGSSPVQSIEEGWGGVSFTFTVPTDVTCCSTNVVLNFVCEGLEPENGSTPWIGFDNFIIS